MNLGIILPSSKDYLEQRAGTLIPSFILSPAQLFPGSGGNRSIICILPTCLYLLAAFTPCLPAGKSLYSALGTLSQTFPVALSQGLTPFVSEPDSKGPVPLVCLPFATFLAAPRKGT